MILGLPDFVLKVIKIPQAFPHLIHMTDTHGIERNPSLIITAFFFLFVFIEHKYSDRMQSQNSQLVLSIYTSENGNKGGLDVSLGKKFITREKAPEVGNAG